MQETKMCEMVQHFQKVTCQKGHGNPEILIKLSLVFEANQNASGGAIKIALMLWIQNNKCCGDLCVRALDLTFSTRKRKIGRIRDQS